MAAEQSTVLSWPYQVDAGTVRAHVVFSGRPLGKCRPRFTRQGHVYTPTQTLRYEAAIKAMLVEKVGVGPPDADARFALRCIFHRPNRQRIDCDNMLKAVSDAATGVVWRDDSQVMEVMGRTYLASDDPRVEVLIHTVPDPSPKVACEHCGKPTNWYKSAPKRFCSKTCASDGRKVDWQCPECKKSFRVQPCFLRRQRMFCSRTCSVNNARRTKTRMCAPKGGGPKCESCGAAVSKRGYKTCRACFRASLAGEKSQRYAADPSLLG